MEDFIQPEDGYRFSEDSIILSKYIIKNPPHNLLNSNKPSKALDIGCGCGIISILLATHFKNLYIDSIEIQTSLTEFAIKNIELFNLQSQVNVINKDIKTLTGLSNPYDLLVSNPPYFPIGSGRIGSYNSRTIGRHEIFLDMKTLLEIGSRLLSKDGLFYLIYPASRKEELLLNLNKFPLDLANSCKIKNRWFISSLSLLFE